MLHLEPRKRAWNASRPGGRRKYAVFGFNQARTLYRRMGGGWQWSVLHNGSDALLDSGWSKTREQAGRDASEARQRLRESTV